MKHHLITLLASLTAILVISCQPQEKYRSGTYYYRYHIINGTSSSVILESATIGKHFEMAAGDTIILSSYGTESSGNELLFLERPSLNNGYKGWTCQEEFTVTYLEKTYVVDQSQANSFLACINYTGKEDSESVFIYDFYFVIDEAYIATLPLKQ